MIKVALHGAEGRMGNILAELLAAESDMELVGLITEPGRAQDVGGFHARLPLIGQDKMAATLPVGCVVVDFSLASALDGLLTQGRELDAPLVIGTTGFSVRQMADLEAYSQTHAVLLAPNFSVGIPTLQMLLKVLAKALPTHFDAEQVETHHITKLDKPSGTAKHLAQLYAQLRHDEDVPTHSQRLGGVIGEHTWTFSDQEETLVLTHRAHSRKAFTRSVVPAVRYVLKTKPGLYSLEDMLTAE